MIKLAFTLFALSTFTFSCKSKKDSNSNSSQTEIMANQKDFEITGVVVSIQNGKDGYRAEIKGEDNLTYFATISIPNLGENSAKYKRFEKGDTATVKGELWMLGDERRITVNDLP